MIRLYTFDVMFDYFELREMGISVLAIGQHKNNCLICLNFRTKFCITYTKQYNVIMNNHTILSNNNNNNYIYII